MDYASQAVNVVFVREQSKNLLTAIWTGCIGKGRRGMLLTESVVFRIITFPEFSKNCIVFAHLLVYDKTVYYRVLGPFM